MKKTLYFLAILLTVEALLISCSKKDQKESITENESVTETFLPATVLTEKLSLCLFGRDEKMHGISSLHKADSVEIVYKNGELKSKEIDGEVYLPAVYKNCDYWINGKNLALNSIPAVIIEKTIPYQDKTLQLPLENKVLSFGSTVALVLDEDHGTENAQKILFIGTNELKDDALYSAWVKNDTLSSSIDDIIVMQVVEGLKVTKKAVPRNELFKKAEKYSPSAKVAAALEAEKVEYVTNSYQDVLNALPGAKIKVNVQELLTVDQSKDPFK